MLKRSFIILLLSMILMLTSCSMLDGLLEEVGINDLKEKFDTAWSEVGKDSLANLADDLWREYGFGSSLDWPETGKGKNIPKLRDGKTVYCYVSESGDSGCIKMKDVGKEKLTSYIDELESLGYKRSLAFSELSDIFSCDGLYCGLKNTDEALFICFGGSVDELNKAFEYAVNVVDKETSDSSEESLP